MTPTLFPGDWLVIAQDVPVRVGDVVVVARPDRPSLQVVKRVTKRLPDGRWWVEGDNPAASDDSRTFGPVPVRCVRGRVVLRYWPPRRAGRDGLRGGPTA